MKPIQRLKKLAIQRETLRLLTDDELARANGGIAGIRTLDWCSTESNGKCAPSHDPQTNPRPSNCLQRL